MLKIYRLASNCCRLAASSRTLSSDVFQKKPISPDVFGSMADEKPDLSVPLSAESLPDDDDHFDEMVINRDKKPREWYRRKFQELVHYKRGGLPEALELFEQMKQRDRQVPQKTHYILLITGCARAGYTEKAFEIFQEMLKKSPIDPTSAMITSLFNACAECPFSEYGLEKARWLRDYCSEKSVVFNRAQYNAMIKAFAKLGDMNTAFEIVNEMVGNKGKVSPKTFSMLLMGCISNKESGLLAAIRIIRRLKQHEREMNIYVYNLLLRAVRDCGVGPKESMEAFLASWSSAGQLQGKQTYAGGSSAEQLSSLPFKMQFENLPATAEADASSVPCIPNLLTSSALSLTGQVVGFDLEALKQPHNRLQLVGGFRGILYQMRRAKIAPTIKTYSLLAECLPPNNESEEQLIQLMQQDKVQPDTDFFNMIIKRRCMRVDLKSATQVVSKMQSYNCIPNIMTYGVFAIGCKTETNIRQLITDMDNAGLTMNTEIISTLILNASHSKNLKCLLYLMKVTESKDLAVSGKAVESMIIAKGMVQDLLVRHERGEEIHPRFLSDEYRGHFRTFKLRFKPWLKSARFEKQQHVWKQYKVEKPDPERESIEAYWKTMQSKLRDRFHKEKEASINSV